MKPCNKCLNWFFFLFIFFLGDGLSRAQTILPEQQGGRYESMVFNALFQSKNKVKKMTGTFSEKRDNMPIEKKPGRIEIEFDRDGRMVRHFRARSIGSLRDTSIHLWEYREEGDVLAETVKNGRSLLRNISVERGDTLYTSSFRVEDEQEFRDLDQLERWWHFDSFQVKKGDDRQRIITYHNELHLPFRSETLKYNDLGYLIERIEVYLMTNRSDIVTLEYNESGRLLKRTLHKGNKDKEEHHFSYDASGLMLTWDVYKNGKKYQHLEVLYDHRGLVEAFITKFEQTQRIEIVQYDYEFYS
ncbi:MAG: hypothetical protein NWQ53_03115 [Flavobacteriales bacterium]|nr:hypothetical protein [Flavobacteriales bacterium]